MSLYYIYDLTKGSNKNKFANNICNRMNYPFLVFKKHEKKLYSNLRNQSLRIQLRIHGKNQRREG